MSIEAVDCHYSITGSGPAIFLTHGIGAAEDAWRFITPKLSENFTVITYDLRGHGKSPATNKNFGLEEFEVHNDMCNVLCDFDKFGVMQDQLANISIDVKSASIERIPNELKELSLDKALKVLNVIDKFEENDDVQKVFHNLSITDNIIKELNK